VELGLSLSGQHLGRRGIYIGRSGPAVRPTNRGAMPLGMAVYRVLTNRHRSQANNGPARSVDRKGRGVGGPLPTRGGM
jgi:hypothetical protein